RSKRCSAAAACTSRACRAMRPRTWVLAGIALFLLGFALTLAFDFDTTGFVGDASDERAADAPQATTRAATDDLERDLRPASGVKASAAPDAHVSGATTPGPANERVRQHANGRLRDRVALDELGRPHGDYTSFHPNGATWETGAFEHGAKTGTWRA